MSRTVFLFGDPVAHSKSPVFQNAGIQASGLNAEYRAKRVIDTELRKEAVACREGGFIGANITLPHKRLAADLADERTAAVEFLGVANTWWSEDGRLLADNTDVFGVQASIASMKLRSLDRVVILGAGGAARGAAFAVCPAAKKLTIVNRTVEKAERLAQSLRDRFDTEIDVHVWHEKPVDAESRFLHDWVASGLVIQATSLPVLAPEREDPFRVFPWEELPAGTGLLELCYAAEDTVPMSLARRSGCDVLDGATMLLQQGARSFERWFGVPAPVEAMRDALASALGRNPREIAARVDPSRLETMQGA